MAQKLPTTVTTPRFRASYPQLFSPKLNKLSGKNEYSIQCLFEAGADLKALEVAAHNACVNKWGPDKSKWPKFNNNPVKSQADMIENLRRKGSDTSHLNPNAKYMTFKTGAVDKNGKAKAAIPVVGKDPKVSLDESQFYAGCWAKANVNASAYSNGANHGVTFYLNAVQFVGHAEPFGNKLNPERAFEAIPDEVTEGGGDAASMFS